MSILDPKTHKVTFFKMPVADPNAPEIVRPSLPCLRHAETDATLGLLGPFATSQDGEPIYFLNAMVGCACGDPR